MSEIRQPEELPESDASPAGANTGEIAATTSAASSGAEQAPKTERDTPTSDGDDPGRDEVLTSYTHTSEGHRITRRSVRRREVSEDTEETITETYPVAYQPPSAATHPAPVG